MLSIIDRWHAKASNRRFEEIYHDRTNYNTIDVLPPLVASPGKELWICFPGFLHMEIRLYHSWGVHNLLPKRGKIMVINGPDSIAGFSPHDSVNAMQLLDAVIRKIIGEHSDFRLNVFGISAGTYPAFYFANTYRAARLIAIAPGPRMGQGIYTSIFSRTLRRRCIQNGFRTWEAYDKVIARFNHENNVANLPEGENLMIFGGRCDRVIRNIGTREIVSICRRAGKNPIFRNYPLLDHITLGAWIAGMNKLGFDPYRLKRPSEHKEDTHGIPF